VRTAEDIDSSTAVVDQTFSAIVERDIFGESSNVVIPAGSRAVLVVREISSGGATGSPDMVLDMQSMTVGGRRYLVSTTDVKQDAGTGIGTNNRTAVAVGGGAAVGTLIGAIAGGKKGAAIGALVGAAGGAGVQVLNRGKDVRVPQRPAHVQAQRARESPGRTLGVARAKCVPSADARRPRPKQPRGRRPVIPCPPEGGDDTR